eukprot:856111_1
MLHHCVTIRELLASFSFHDQRASRVVELVAGLALPRRTCAVGYHQHHHTLNWLWLRGQQRLIVRLARISIVEESGLYGSNTNDVSGDWMVYTFGLNWPSIVYNGGTEVGSRILLMHLKHIMFLYSAPGRRPDVYCNPYLRCCMLPPTSIIWLGGV